MAQQSIDWGIARQRIASLHPNDFLNLRSIGYTLQRAWVFLLFLGVGYTELTATGDPTPNLLYVISSITLCLTLFVSAAIPVRVHALMSHNVRRWMGPVCTTLGTLLIFFIYLDDDATLALSIASGVLTGFGSGIIDLGYGEIYRNEPVDKTDLEIPFATLLASAIFAATTELPPLVNQAVVLVLPLASGYILLVSNKIWKPGFERSAQPIAVNVKRFTWRIGMCACVVGAADSFARQTFVYINQVPLDEFYQPSMLLSCLIMFVLLVGYRLLAKDPNYLSMYRFVTYTMAFFFMLLPVFTTSGTFENTIALVSYNCFNVLIWMLLAELCYTYRLSSMVVFGIGWGMVTLGVAIGQVVSQEVIKAVAVFTPQGVSLVALIVTMITLGSYMFILPEDEMEDITSIDGDKQGETSDQGVNVAYATPFRDRCNLVAEQYHLTPRETEIMTLFAKGRTSARIQEELVLSRGTVTSHLQHVYQKVGVHSKQELLDVIEGAKR
jgi:DNA-binding CsgD family transcriptional regulator